MLQNATKSPITSVIGLFAGAYSIAVGTGFIHPELFGATISALVVSVLGGIAKDPGK